MTGSWSGIMQDTPPHKGNIAKQRTVQIYEFSSKNDQNSHHKVL